MILKPILRLNGHEKLLIDPMDSSDLQMIFYMSIIELGPPAQAAGSCPFLFVSCRILVALIHPSTCCPSNRC